MGYLSFKSALGKPALRCPGMNCECHLKKAEVKILAPVAYADYEAAMMRYSLKKINNFRICPNADCSAGLVVDVDCKAEKITCTACDFSFCPHCNDLPHPGMSCEDMRRQRHEERWEGEEVSEIIAPVAFLAALYDSECESDSLANDDVEEEEESHGPEFYGLFAADSDSGTNSEDDIDDKKFDYGFSSDDEEESS